MTSKHAKKRPPEGWHLRAVASRACAEELLHEYYIKFPAKCKPNLDRGGGALPMSWGFALAVIGAAWLVGRFARLIDWIER